MLHSCRNVLSARQEVPQKGAEKPYGGYGMITRQPGRTTESTTSLAAVHADAEREAVVCPAAQQRAGRPGGRAQDLPRARQRLQEHAVRQVRQRAGPRPLCSSTAGFDGWATRPAGPGACRNMLSVRCVSAPGPDRSAAAEAQSRATCLTRPACSPNLLAPLRREAASKHSGGHYTASPCMRVQGLLHGGRRCLG